MRIFDKKFLAILIITTFFLSGVINFVLAANACDPCDTDAECTPSTPALSCVGGDPSTTEKKEGTCQDTSGNVVTICSPTTYQTFGELVNAIIDFIFNIALALAPLMFIIAGVYFVTAAGDPNQIQKAKDIMLYTFVGLLILLLAKGIIKLISCMLNPTSC